MQDLSNKAKNIVRADMVRIIPLTKNFLENKKIIDIGCGSGLAALFMQNSFQNEISLCDVEDNRATEAKSLPFKLLTSKNKLPYLDNEFQISYLQYVIHHLDIDIKSFFTEIFRISSEAMVIVEEVYEDDGKMDLYKSLDHSSNQLLHPNSSFPVVNFLKADELKEMAEQSGWSLANFKKIENIGYMSVGIYTFVKNSTVI
ncbi:MAG: methyltransferase domain-containing protein [Ignavibacteria bacterium]|nr:methyltransferase domain-containing protein [Ignavibacteria bacterium]